MELETNNRRKTQFFNVEIKQHTLKNNHQVKEENTSEIRK